MLLVESVSVFFEHVDDGVVAATTETLSILLLVFIFVELLGAVRVIIRERRLVAEPFLLVGIIAAIKEIVVVAGAEQPDGRRLRDVPRRDDRDRRARRRSCSCSSISACCSAGASASRPRSRRE